MNPDCPVARRHRRDAKAFADLAAAPVGYMQHFLGAKLYGKQQEVARSVVEHKKTVVQSCNGAGKTFLAARIGIAFLQTRPDSKVITTAPTWRQVTDLTWREWRAAVHNAPVAGLAGQLAPKAPRHDVDDEWYAAGFSSDKAVNFQGTHAAGGVLIIVDEAAGIPEEVWHAIEGCLVDEDKDRLLAIANPVDPSGHFFELCKGHDANVIKISAFDTPNLIAGSTVVPGMIGPRWVAERKRVWGVDSPLYQARVLGEFPTDASDCLVPLSWCEAAQARHDELEPDDWTGPAVWGVDVARLGGDRTVVACRRDQGIEWIEVLPQTDTMATAGALIARARSSTVEVEELRIDADGLGAGIYDRVREQMPQVAVPMQGGRKPPPPIDEDRWQAGATNARSSWFWDVREALDPKSVAPIALPPDASKIAGGAEATLKSQLSSLKWRHDSQGRVRLETKDEMRRRRMTSPHEADAVAYALGRVDDDRDICDFF